MDQIELDRQYDARGTVDDIAPFIDRYASLSAQARASLACKTEVSFGPHADELLDFFSAGVNAPILVFIHGGYWRLLSKNESAFMAKTFTDAGIAVAALNYALAPAVTLDVIVSQIRTAIAHLYKHSKEYQIDRKRIIVAGSSAGAHLAAMVLAGGWHASVDLPENVVAGAILASGLYDLEPLRWCKPNQWLNLDKQAAHRNSPVHHLPRHNDMSLPRPVIVTWGGSETDEFKRQSRDFAKTLTEAHFKCTAFEVSDRNHFDIILDLADPDRELAQRTIELIAQTK